MKKNSEFLFICWRPYQIFNTVNFVKNNLENCATNSDIIIYLDFINANKIAEKIIKEDLFNNVYKISKFHGTKKQNLMERIKILFYFIFPCRTLKKYSNNTFDISKKEYHYIIASGWQYVFQIICGYFKKAHTYFLEDGTQTYFKNEIGYNSRNTIASKMMKNFFNKGVETINIEKIFVNNFQFLDIQNTICREQLPYLTSDLLELLYKIFDFKQEHNDYNNFKIIYLDTPIYVERNFQKEEELIKELENTNKLIIRKHPNEKEMKFNCKLYGSEEMWELLCGEKINNDHILISLFSMAAFSPKLLFDKEPYLIFLYKLLDYNIQQKIMYDNMIERLKKIYQKNKIFVPIDQNEFFEVLNSIKN